MDSFFRKETCDRCFEKLTSRQMSWFNEDCLCQECIEHEQKIKTKINEKGLKSQDFEGCGYIPDPDKL
ncbi:MAG: gamma-glutamylcyclotransferase [Bacteriovoracaceae bacterium]